MKSKAMAEPTPQVYFLGAKAAYLATPPPRLGDYKFALNTPTLKAYTRTVNAKVVSVLVCVRGTADGSDLVADAMIIANKLASSARYQRDLATMRGLKARYPTATWFACGHSLAASVIVQLQRDLGGIFKGALLFNGAMQPKDVPKSAQPAGFREIYAQLDPLYNTLGQRWADKTVVPSAVKPAWTSIGRVSQSLQAHRLETLRAFVGAGKPRGDAELRRLEAIPMTDDQMRLMLGAATPVMTLPDLDEHDHIEDALGPSGMACVLELTANRQCGHWTMLLLHHGQIEYFNSYGMPPTGRRADIQQWLSERKRESLGEADHPLDRLIADAAARGIAMVYNNVQLQAMGARIETCGRHVGVRGLHGDMPLSAYLQLVKDSGLAPDEFVTRVSERLLDRK